MTDTDAQHTGVDLLQRRDSMESVGISVTSVV